METQLFSRGGELHILLHRCVKTPSGVETHKPTIRATISTSISPSVAAPLPLRRTSVQPNAGDGRTLWCRFLRSARSVCFCLCLFVLRSLGSLHPNPADSFFLSLAQLAAALAFSSPLPASPFPPCVFPSLSLLSAGNLKLSSLFPAPTLDHPPTPLSS